MPVNQEFVQENAVIRCKKTEVFYTVIEGQIIDTAVCKWIIYTILECECLLVHNNYSIITQSNCNVYEN